MCGHEVPDVGVRVNQPLASTGTLLALRLHLNSSLINMQHHSSSHVSGSLREKYPNALAVAQQGAA